MLALPNWMVLHMNDEIKASSDAEKLRVRLRFDLGVVTVSKYRGQRLRRGCRQLARRKNVCGRRLEKIMEHRALACLLVRGSLSIMFEGHTCARAQPLPW